MTGKAGQARALLDQLAEVGIDFEDVMLVLESEGVDKFKKSWVELVETVQGQMDAARVTDAAGPPGGPRGGVRAGPARLVRRQTRSASPT